MSSTLVCSLLTVNIKQLCYKSKLYFNFYKRKYCVFKMSSKVVNESSMFYIDFCPNCSNILHLDEYMGEMRQKCQVCPYFSAIKNVMLASRSFYKLKVKIIHYYYMYCLFTRTDDSHKLTT